MQKLLDSSYISKGMEFCAYALELLCNFFSVLFLSLFLCRFSHSLMSHHSAHALHRCLLLLLLMLLLLLLEYHLLLLRSTLHQVSNQLLRLGVGLLLDLINRILWHMFRPAELDSGRGHETVVDDPGLVLHLDLQGSVAVKMLLCLLGSLCLMLLSLCLGLSLGLCLRLSLSLGLLLLLHLCLNLRLGLGLGLGLGLCLLLLLLLLHLHGHQGLHVGIDIAIHHLPVELPAHQVINLPAHLAHASHCL